MSEKNTPQDQNRDTLNTFADTLGEPSPRDTFSPTGFKQLSTMDKLMDTKQQSTFGEAPRFDVGLANTASSPQNAGLEP